jgi:hypothetical protein
MNLASVHFTGLLPGQGVAVAVAGIGLVAWFGLLGMMAVATRSPSPRPGMPPDPNRLDAESSAIVDLLTGGWNLCEEAAAATVLDLAARRVVAVEEIGPELSLVRLGRGDTPDLNPYEQPVLDHLRRLATSDGVVATGALAEGNRHIGSWWKSFTHAVIEEARARGLSQRRWTAWAPHRPVGGGGGPGAGGGGHLHAGPERGRQPLRVARRGLRRRRHARRVRGEDERRAGHRPRPRGRRPLAGTARAPRRRAVRRAAGRRSPSGVVRSRTPRPSGWHPARW